MQYWRCKCGKVEYFESGMPPRKCQGCEECGTTFAMRADDHRPIQPHDLGPVQVEGNADNPIRYRRCRRCFHRERLTGDAGDNDGQVQDQDQEDR